MHAVAHTSLSPALVGAKCCPLVGLHPPGTTPVGAARAGGLRLAKDSAP